MVVAELATRAMSKFTTSGSKNLPTFLFCCLISTLLYACSPSGRLGLQGVGGSSDSGSVVVGAGGRGGGATSPEGAEVEPTEGGGLEEGSSANEDGSSGDSDFTDSVESIRLSVRAGNEGAIRETDRLICASGSHCKNSNLISSVFDSNGLEGGRSTEISLLPS